MSVLLLSRLQFAITISFHIIFPAFSIGLVSYLVLIEGLWLKTKKKCFYRTARYLTKLIALNFGMGVISGLAMAFQMGTNWAGFSKLVGPVLGVLFTLESLTAFFVEAMFLGIMLLGWRLVKPKFHFISTILVCLGVTLSAFWIMAANSWMQTPAGVSYINQKFIVNNWWDVIFNHSTLLRFFHMLLSAYIATLMMIALIAATALLKRRYKQFGAQNLKLSFYLLALLVPTQIVMGDLVGLNVHRTQPVKTAAIEGLWQSQKGAPLLLFANIKQDEQRNTSEIKIPKLASIINTHDPNGEIKGLKAFDKSLHPRVAIVFYSFRIMVGMGLLILAVTIWGLYLLKKNRLNNTRHFLKLIVLVGPSGFIALLSGWFTAEVGRQPWVVYGLVKTKSVVSEADPNSVFKGFIVLILVYGIIFCVGYLGLMIRLIRKGPVIQLKARKRLLKREH